MRILQHLSADFETIGGSRYNNLIGHINFFFLLFFFWVSSPYIFAFIFYTYILTLGSIHTGLRECIASDENSAKSDYVPNHHDAHNLNIIITQNAKGKMRP